MGSKFDLAFETELRFQYLLGSISGLLVFTLGEETFGFNIVESLSIGLPVLAFPAKSIKEIADSNPIAFFFKDEKSFLNKIDNEICNITSDEKNRSIQTIKKTFHLNLMISNYDKIYKKLI